LRRGAVVAGIRFITAGVVVVIAATYFSDFVARIFNLGTDAQNRFIVVGLTWGAIFGCTGIVTATAGFLAYGREGEKRITLLRPLLILVFALLLFFILFFYRGGKKEAEPLRPGETITI
jgi:hypothetical protein